MAAHPLEDETLSQFLQRLGLDRHEPLLASFDLPTLSNMDDQELKSIGLGMGARRKIQHGLRERRERIAPPSSSSSTTSTKPAKDSTKTVVDEEPSQPPDSSSMSNDVEKELVKSRTRIAQLEEQLESALSALRKYSSIFDNDGEKNAKERVIGFIHLGEMSSVLATHLAKRSVNTILFSSAISPSSIDIARTTGILDVSNLKTLCERSHIIFSLLPPTANASDVCRLCMREGFRGVYCDANALSPREKGEIARIVLSSGGEFVDCCVCGPTLPLEKLCAPNDDDDDDDDDDDVKSHKATLFLSGNKAHEVASVFQEEGSPSQIQPKVVSNQGGSVEASQAWICAEGWAMGSAALLANTLSLASSYGPRVSGALQHHWSSTTSYMEHLQQNQKQTHQTLPHSAILNICNAYASHGLSAPPFEFGNQPKGHRSGFELPNTHVIPEQWRFSRLVEKESKRVREFTIDDVEDAMRDVEEGEEEEEDEGRSICPAGHRCESTDPDHWLRYKHTKAERLSPGHYEAVAIGRHGGRMKHHQQHHQQHHHHDGGGDDDEPHHLPIPPMAYRVGRIRGRDRRRRSKSSERPRPPRRRSDNDLENGSNDESSDGERYGSYYGREEALYGGKKSVQELLGYDDDDDDDRLLERYPCPLGPACMHTDPEHFIRFSHTERHDEEDIQHGAITAESPSSSDSKHNTKDTSAFPHRANVPKRRMPPRTTWKTAQRRTKKDKDKDKDKDKEKSGGFVRKVMPGARKYTDEERRAAQAGEELASEWGTTTTTTEADETSIEHAREAKLMLSPQQIEEYKLRARLAYEEEMKLEAKSLIKPPLHQRDVEEESSPSSKDAAQWKKLVEEGEEWALALGLVDVKVHKSRPRLSVRKSFPHDTDIHAEQTKSDDVESAQPRGRDPRRLDVASHVDGRSSFSLSISNVVKPNKKHIQHDLKEDAVEVDGRRSFALSISQVSKPNASPGDTHSVAESGKRDGQVDGISSHLEEEENKRQLVKDDDDDDDDDDDGVVVEGSGLVDHSKVSSPPKHVLQYDSRSGSFSINPSDITKPNTSSPLRDGESVESHQEAFMSTSPPTIKEKLMQEANEKARKTRPIGFTRETSIGGGGGAERRRSPPSPRRRRANAQAVAEKEQEDGPAFSLTPSGNLAVPKAQQGKKKKKKPFL